MKKYYIDYNTGAGNETANTFEDASSVADWIELFLEENEQHSVETISLNIDLAKLEEILEGRGYKVEKNGSFWTVRRNNNVGQGR